MIAPALAGKSRRAAGLKAVQTGYLWLELRRDELPVHGLLPNLDFASDAQSCAESSRLHRWLRDAITGVLIIFCQAKIVPDRMHRFFFCFLHENLNC